MRSWSARFCRESSCPYARRLNHGTQIMAITTKCQSTTVFGCSYNGVCRSLEVPSCTGKLLEYLALTPVPKYSQPSRTWSHREPITGRDQSGFIPGLLALQFVTEDTMPSEPTHLSVTGVRDVETRKTSWHRRLPEVPSAPTLQVLIRVTPTLRGGGDLALTEVQ